jgi:Dna[CI] antecedent, DciA
MNYSKKDNIKTIRQCIDQFLETGPMAKKMQKSALKQAWKEIAGESVNNRTQELWYQEGKLVVRVGSGPLKHFLLTNRSKLKEKIKEKLPQIDLQEIVIL